MLIEDISKGAQLSRLVRDRAFVNVVGGSNVVLLDPESIPDACFVIDVVARFIARQDIVIIKPDGGKGGSKLGIDLVRSLDGECGDLAKALSGSRLHPYIEAFLAMQEIFNSRVIFSGFTGCRDYDELFNRVEGLRAELDRKIGIENIRKKARGYERSARKGVEDYTTYVGKMFELQPDARVAVVEIRYRRVDRR